MVTLVQRMGNALHLNMPQGTSSSCYASIHLVHLYMLCLDGVNAPRSDSGLRFRRVKAPERE